MRHRNLPGRKLLVILKDRNDDQDQTMGVHEIMQNAFTFAIFHISFHFRLTIHFIL